ncbi:PAN domain-containing protein 13 [Elsinoe australis]|uniref:PAN domain-containing protein 13 n=1 Tax=Elsinoe australis TaxID=40998 RepID=A0A4U7AKH1_9PEZI|nr:PAN domain-containing protein 13 [Elsinoe australis]
MHHPKAIITAAALVGLAAASPAPQNLDLGAILNAPQATISGPSLAAISQTSVINTAAIIASISQVVSTSATAQITGAAALNAANILPSGKSKRDVGSAGLEKRGLLDSLLALAGLKLQSTAVSAQIAAATSAISTVTNVLSCASINALTYATTKNQYTVRCGMDVATYGDIGNALGTGFTDCLSKCDAFSGCCAVTWAQQSKICYFKNLKGLSTAPMALAGADIAFLPSLYPAGLSGLSTSASKAATSAAAIVTSQAAAVVTSSAAAVVTSSVSVAVKAASSSAAAAVSTVSSAAAAIQTDGGMGLPGGAPAVAPTSAPAVSSATSALSTGGSATTSSDGACATTPEDGTYCGFINPEDPCAPQPDAFGPNITNPDTVDNWMSQASFQNAALNAVTPDGWVRTFNNMNGSTSASSYMGLWTLKSYDPSQCAAICTNNTGCTSFNIFIERDPSLNPCKNDSTAYTPWGYWCPLPSSITNYKCTLWGSNIDASTATNMGGWRGDFNVVITGSNGYDKTNVTTPVKVPIYDPPQNCSNQAINGGSYWMGSKFFSGPFNPTLCHAYANATNIANEAAAIKANQTTFTPCQMFNAYHIYKNNAPMGTYCSLYDAQLSTKWASVQGTWSGRNYYGVRNSWQYQRTTPHSGKCGSGY